MAGAKPRSGSRNWVISAGVKGVALQEPNHSQQGSFEGPMFFYSLARVLGATRVKTASRGQKGRYENLIGPDREQQDRLDTFFEHSLSARTVQDSLQFFLQVMVVQPGRSRMGDDHYVMSPGQACLVQSEEFPNVPFDSVAGDR